MSDNKANLDDNQIAVDDVLIESGSEGVYVKGRGGMRFITYTELVELADSDDAVLIR